MRLIVGLVGCAALALAMYSCAPDRFRANDADAEPGELASGWTTRWPAQDYAGFRDVPSSEFAEVVESARNEAMELLATRPTHVVSFAEARRFWPGSCPPPQDGRVYVLLRGVKPAPDDGPFVDEDAFVLKARPGVLRLIANGSRVQAVASMRTAVIAHLEAPVGDLFSYANVVRRGGYSAPR